MVGNGNGAVRPAWREKSRLQGKQGDFSGTTEKSTYDEIMESCFLDLMSRTTMLRCRADLPETSRAIS